MGALCTRGEVHVAFEPRAGVAGQDDIAARVLEQRLLLSGHDLHQFFRLFSRLQRREAEARGRERERERSRERHRREKRNEFDADLEEEEEGEEEGEEGELLTGEWEGE
jgi:hypothetical protein